MDIPVDKCCPGDYGTHIKELVPGIERKDEKDAFAKMSSHESQLKNEELFYRVQQR
jgi:hypothetical protein